jgi:DMSO/TMAO reductase YedYZ molybdopterin-dependent catalytic subunit
MNITRCLAGFALIGFLAGCGGGSDAAEASVRLAGAIDRPATLSLATLQRQPPVTQAVTFHSGTTPQTHSYTGASTWGLLSGAGIQLDASSKSDGLNRYLLATGADGYRAVFSLGELNPDFGNRPSIVAYAETTTGTRSALDASSGPLRITAPGHVKGGRYVSQLTTLEVRASGSTAAGSGGGTSNSFAVSGAVTRPATFDLAALQRLPATSQTVGGVVYTGVSLWTLLDSTTGLQTDSSLKNPALSMYAVATGTDGYKALVSLGEVDPGFGNRAVLVAHTANGTGLGANGVARLVVPGDGKLGRSVSNLGSIEVFTAPASP